MKQKTRAQLQDEIGTLKFVVTDLNEAIRELQAKATAARELAAKATSALARVVEERDALCTAIGATLVDIKTEHQAATFARILSEVVRASSGQKQ